MERKVYVNLDEVAREVGELPDPRPERTHRARRAGDLIRAVLEMPGGESASLPDGSMNVPWLMAQDEAVFEDARTIIRGGDGDPALVLEGETIEPEAFTRLVHKMSNLDASSDPARGGEFV